MNAMPHGIDHTHDPAALSWVASANQPGCEFPLQNLPIAVGKPTDHGDGFGGVIAIADQALSLQRLLDTGVLQGEAIKAIELAALPTLNKLMAAGPAVWQLLRHTLFDLLSATQVQTVQEKLVGCLLPISSLQFCVPTNIGDYTDFYTSYHHANNIARIAGVKGPSGTNFEWLPIAYHGRASSVCISGTGFKRPHGQVRLQPDQAPVFSACQRLDYELEIGVFVGEGNQLGQPISLAQATQHMFGLCLLNDWSARDIQFWEMAPLGPFLGKNFCTTISPWIVMAQALLPFACAAQRFDGQPEPLAYLDSPTNRQRGGFDIGLEVFLSSSQQRAKNIGPTRLSATSFKHQSWTIAQMITQHTVNGCNLQPGDLLGTGTISGPGADQAGAIIELTRAGTMPLTLEGGEQRAFLQDGDQVIFKARCEAPNAKSIGFGVCWGEVQPALSTS
jgi:fumarylacetoacetase